MQSVVFVLSPGTLWKTVWWDLQLSWDTNIHGGELKEILEMLDGRHLSVHVLWTIYKVWLLHTSASVVVTFLTFRKLLNSFDS